MYAVLSKESLEYPVKLMTWIYGLKIKTKAKTKKKKRGKKEKMQTKRIFYYILDKHIIF